MVRGVVSGVLLCSEKRSCESGRMRVDLRRFKVSRVAVGGLGRCGRVEESVVAEVESGEA